MVKNGTRSVRARFRYARGRDYKPQANPETHGSKRRETSTQFTGCKLQLAARPLPDRLADALAPFEREVVKLSNSGFRPAQVLAAIQAEQRGIRGQDIINLLQRHRRAELRGRSRLQCLYEDYLKPEASKFIGLQLLKQNPDLLLLDTTYKTNQHNMPLFSTCGVTSGNKTFNWAVTFMGGEKKGAITAAL
ncbi:hypothetical protein VTI74DRAFT_9920 [Chaetomium olivicolor]